MQEVTVILGITAALLHGVAYVLYNLQAKKGQSSPNAVSWSIWAFLAILNAFSYREMSGDLVATLQFITGSVACTFTFFFALFIGSFSWPEREDWYCFALGLMAGLVWWKLKSAAGANMVILVAFLISFFPTLRGVWKDPSKETSRPWTIWSVAFVITTANVVLRDCKPIALLMPIVLLIAHGSIAVLSRKGRKIRFVNLG